jgi:hypothetical protein
VPFVHHLAIAFCHRARRNLKTNQESVSMGLFTPDLYRSFAIGFAVGVVIIGASAVRNWDTDLASPAQAATAVQEAGNPSE